MRLGDLDALKEDLKQYFSDGTLDSVSAKLAFNMILRKIDEVPTVSEITKEKLSNAYDQGYEDGKNNWLQEERPHGEWKYNQYDGNPNIGNWHCSNCHNICYEMKIAHNNFNYCPNCGADMRKGEDNDKEETT